MKKIYVWTVPTRVFHILFALLILLAFVTSDSDRLLNWHAIIGYSILIVLLFRFIWFFIGPQYSKWKDFTFSLTEYKLFLLNIFSDKHKYIGHNPLASWVMVLMLAVTFVIVISGVFTFGIQESQGPLSFLNHTFFKKMELFEELHETLSGVLIALVVFHLGGIVVDKLLHGKMQTVQSIVNGYKMSDEPVTSVKLHWYQKVISLLFLIFFIAYFAFVFLQPNNVLIASNIPKVNFEKEHVLFSQECGSCHMIYAPSFLPKESWITMMSQLENHFGDDASLEPSEQKTILNYLLKNAAENSSSEASFKILTSIKNKDIMAISETPYWKSRHQKLPKKLFEHEKIRNKSNCQACHVNIEQGVILDANIQNMDRFN